MDMRPTRYVSEDEIRTIFNDNGYLERMRNGEFQRDKVESEHRTSPRVNQPECTWSERVRYLDEYGRPVAIVHQFRRHGGIIGASGKPDPKMVWHDGIVYKVVK